MVPRRRTRSSGADALRVWNAKTGEPLAVVAGASNVKCLAFSPNGRLLGTGLAVGKGDSPTGDVAVWDTNAWRARTVAGAHAGIVSAVAFSPDGRTLATSSTDGTTKLWNFGTLPSPVLTKDE